MNGYVISSRTLVACDCLFMLELKLHHVSKGGPGWVTSWCKQRRKLIVPASKRETNGRNEFCRKMKCIYQIYDFPLFCTFHVNKTNSWWYFFSGVRGYNSYHRGISTIWDQFGGECRVQDWSASGISTGSIIVSHNLHCLPICQISSQQNPGISTEEALGA